MSYKLREIAPDSKFSRSLSCTLLQQIIPLERIKAVLSQHHATEKRERKLNMVVIIWVLIAMNLFTDCSLGYVLRKLAQGLRYIWPDPDYALPGDNAITYRRYQLGPRPLVALFKQCCHPIATRETPGAFRFGLRLMAIDSTIEDVADTPANDQAFGRLGAVRGQSAFPQVRCVYLVECGTHAIVDAGVWPCQTAERLGGFRLLRSITPDMLLMWDRGFHSCEMFRAVRRRGAHALSRLPKLVQPEYLQRLCDGSWLAYLYPKGSRLKRQSERILVRVIEYTLTDPTRSGYDEPHRIVTTLLDPYLARALDLVDAYHERWEIETTIDEVDTHQRLINHPLRSKKPVGVIQEIYALLIAHFILRSFMHQAALEARVDPDRLSFLQTVRLVQDALPEFEMTMGEHLPALFPRLLHDLSTQRLPKRRRRCNPRVVKRKMSDFPLKRPEHLHPPKPTCSFREAVLLI